MEAATHHVGLDDRLDVYPIPRIARERITKCLFGEGNVLPPTYFEFYSKRVQRHLLSGKPFCLQTHRDVVFLGKMILDGLPREEIRLQFPFRGNAIDTTNDAIDLCASLLLMAEIETPQNECVRTNHGGVSGRTAIPWATGTSLHEALANHFVPQTKLQADDQKLGRVFTAQNISQMGGIEIRWTTNLEDHLRLMDDDQTLLIFCGAVFLQLQNKNANGLLPNSLVTETLETLALLFPSNDKRTRKWLSRNEGIQHRKFLTPPEPEIGKCGALRTSQRRIDNFHIWHDRLVILKQAFDDSQPTSLSRWWFDRRNRVQWYTFWVAVLVFVMTIFFGLVQSIEGGLQVYLAFKSDAQEE